MTPCIQALSLYRRVKMGQKAHYVAETLWATERVEDFTLGIINVRLMSRNREKCLVNAYDRGIRMRMAGGCRFRVVSCCGLIGSEESEGWAKILVYSSGLKSAHCNQRDNQTTPPNWKTKLASCQTSQNAGNQVICHQNTEFTVRLGWWRLLLIPHSSFITHYITLTHLTGEYILIALQLRRSYLGSHAKMARSSCSTACMIPSHRDEVCKHQTMTPLALPWVLQGDPPLLPTNTLCVTWSLAASAELRRLTYNTFCLLLARIYGHAGHGIKGFRSF
jgi:hypothetical protein